MQLLFRIITDILQPFGCLGLSTFEKCVSANTQSPIPTKLPEFVDCACCTDIHKNLPSILLVISYQFNFGRCFLYVRMVLNLCEIS